MKLLDEIPKFLLSFGLLLPGESSGWAWTSRWCGLGHQQLPDPFPILYSWGLCRVLPPLLAHSGSPDFLPFAKELAIPKVCCGLQRKRMERTAEVAACALLRQGSMQLPTISGKWLCFGIPRSGTVSAYSVRVWSGGQGSIAVKFMCSEVMSQDFWGKKDLFF